MAAPPPAPKIRTQDTAVEVAWFGDCCNGDCRYLGVLDDDLRSSFEHVSDIVRRADAHGFQNILLPSSWISGQEVIPFAAATGMLTEQINSLIAVRMAEVHPPMLARHIATLDHILKGRLTVNIISSDLPGERMESAPRYARSREALDILKQCWTQDEIHYRGEFYTLDLSDTTPAKPYQQNGGPLLYFGGISPPALQLCADFCDVYLLWPETEEHLSATMHQLSQMAGAAGRTVDFGLRIHVIVRETEAEAREAAQRLLSKLDAARGEELKARSQDNKSAGVLRQDALRAQSKDDYIEELVWSGIGRARSGCASAIVGDPDQVYDKLQRYIQMGMRAFILSGYPLLDECDLFAKYVLPRLDTCKLNEVQRRKVADPVTPLTTAPRV
jgi:alkanesulfonate monooxygenase